RRRAADRDPPHQVHDEPLAAHGRADLRRLARLRIPRLHRARAEGGPRLDPREAQGRIPDPKRFLGRLARLLQNGSMASYVTLTELFQNRVESPTIRRLLLAGTECFW